MNNLFLSFNPSASFLQLNWMLMMVLPLMIPSPKTVCLSRFQSLFSMLKVLIMKELHLITLKMDTKGVNILFFMMFTLIMLMNTTSLIPHVFTLSSHPSIILPLSFSTWFMFMLFSWINNTNNTFQHLVPQNTPPLLIPLMIMIESISLIIRPITLAIRLSANMIAGHLLLILMSTPMSTMNTLMYQLTLIPHMTLMTLEMAVALIQGYVFMVLISLYYSDIS